MTRTSSILVCVSVLLLSACAGFHIRPPVASRPVVVSSFEVVYGAQIPGDRQNLLNRHLVPARMATALRTSYPAGPGPLVRVIITQFRAGRWGPTRMHATVQVLGPQMNVLNQFETDSSSGRGNRTRRIQSIAQDTVNQVAQRL